MPVVNVCDVDHGGTTRRVNVPDGCTVNEYIQRKKPGFKAGDYNVRLNEERINDFDQPLKADDRLTFARAKLAGA